MKRVVKAFAFIVLLMVIGAAGLWTFSNFKVDALMKKHVTVELVEFSVPTDTDSIQRGERLMRMKGCIDCHDADLGGRTFIHQPPLGIYSGSNLTRGAGSKILEYSDPDWIRAIRFGIAPSGRPLVFMPSTDYMGMSNEDLGLLIAYLKQVPSVNRASGEVTIGPAAKVMHTLGNMPVLFSFQQIDFNLKPVDHISIEPTAKYGQYLIQSCIGCHGANLTGGKIAGTPPSWPAASNIGKGGKAATWSYDDFKKVLSEGITPDGHSIDPQYMPWQATREMNDTEMTAVYEYIKSLN